MNRRRWPGHLWMVLAALLLHPSGGTAQSRVELVKHVAWPLLDVVLVPDSCSGMWLIVAPSPASTAWESRTPLVHLGLDPVEALQWATVARGLAPSASAVAAPRATRVTPPLRHRRGKRLMLLALNGDASGPDEQFILAVSDSTSNTHWRAFASAVQVDSLLAAFEGTAERAFAMQAAPDTTDPLMDDDPAIDSPVEVEFIPKPEYPRQLWRKGRVGRVWLEFVVGDDGRTEEGSFRVLLSDHERFTEAAVRALYRGKFRPARSRGAPIRQRVFQVITFRMG